MQRVRCAVGIRSTKSANNVPVSIGGNWSLSESKIKQSGLTQYKKVEQGVYERTAGTGGPEHLFRD